jgi:hypothetical protein
VSSEDFGFSDEAAANREQDEFAGMSEEEFTLLMDVTERIMQKRSLASRREALGIAREIVQTVGDVVTGSGRIGFRKYGNKFFMKEVLEALISGEKPCVHGHLESLSDCGACFAQTRIDAHVQNPVQGSSTRCTHTRIDLVAFDPDNPNQAQPPCPSCEDEDAEELKEFEKKATAPFSTHPRPKYHVKPKSFLDDYLQGSKPGAPILKLQGNEAELNAIIGVLLDRLGGEVELSHEEVERLSTIVDSGHHTYAISPMVASFGIRIERVGPSVTPASANFFRPGGMVTPVRTTSPNPSGTPSEPTWSPLGASEDDEDIPF